MTWIILGAIAGFLAVILVRAALFTPKPAPKSDLPVSDFDADEALTALQKLVQCKTVSHYDPKEEDDAEFRKLVSLLPDLYPNVMRECSMERFEGRALLIRWRGKSEDADPAVMMSHYDVVPVNEDAWDKDPFGGVIEDGVLWGRGTLDTKATMNGALFAANTLIAEGFVPERDVYFAFSGGEEVNGKGASNIVDYFEKNNLTPHIVLDEGGAVVEGVFPGVKAPCGLIGIAEKGMMNVKFSVESGGGHASAPAPVTSIGRLSKACCNMEKHPFPMHMTKPTALMFDTLGRHSGFALKIIFANMRLFGGVIGLLGRLTGGEINALVRTTVAFTQMEGSQAPNVMPPAASMVANLRLNPKETVEKARARIVKTVNDPKVSVTVMESEEPSRISRTDCEGYDKVAAAVASTWKGAIVSPYLMVQCSDSRHWGRISDRVYRFSAMDMTGEERRTIHGNNERIRADAVKRSVEFYLRLLSQC